MKNVDFKKIFNDVLQKLINWFKGFLNLDSMKLRFKNFKKSSKFFFKSIKWTRLDAYIMKNFIISFIGSLLLFITIYELVQVFQDIRSIPKDVNAGLLIKRYVLESFYWILILQPFSFLFATIFVLSGLAKHKELTAMVSTGTSLQRITIFMVLFSIVYYILTITFFADVLIYPAYQKSEIVKKIVFNKMNKEQLDRLKDNKDFFLFGSEGIIYIGSYYNAISQEITKLTVIKYNTFKEQQVIDQKGIAVLTNNTMWMSTNVEVMEKTRELSQEYKIDVNLRIDAEKAIWDKKNKTWMIINGTVRYIENEGRFFKIQKFVNQRFDFIKDSPEYFENVWYNVDAMTTWEARKHIKRLKKARLDFKDAQSRYISKFSYPFGIIMVVLAGIGIINISSRKVSIVKNFFISLIVFIIYYLFFSIGISLASKGTVPAFIGGFTGTFVLSLIAVTLYIRTKT